MKYPQIITDLIEDFKMLPSIGAKTAERLVMYIYSEMDITKINKMASDLQRLKQDIHKCIRCGNLTLEEECEICKDDHRDKKTIMVVESIKDLFTIERVDEYVGLYHVLGGAISFSNGVGVDDIEIASLIKRVKDESIDEIILATNATVEGETTARYIKALLEGVNVAVTRIAHGLPVGGDLQYADEMTLLKALEGRRNY